MAGLKEVLMFIVEVALVFQWYFLMEDSYFKIMRGTTPESTLLSNVSNSPSQCNYRVQIYNDNTIKSTGLEGKVSCQNKCVVEITTADGKDKFAGMDAVVFHILPWGTYIPRSLPPANMNPSQTWVYFTQESPRSNAAEGHRVTGLPVNVMWTYHRESDLGAPYGLYNPRTPMAKEAKSVDEWLRQKTKFAMWMASNCRSTWPRTNFVRQLKKYIPVDMYGACGNLSCSHNTPTKCNVDLVRQYKFYLSLENAECEDYITEKAWGKPLIQGVVPVVYGPQRKVYEELLPPNSFIYIGDYKNISELANYLKLLDSKPELYVQYLKWQYQGTIGGRDLKNMSCDLIPFIDKVKRGELKRTPVGETSFSKTCRTPDQKKDSTSAFWLENWYPW